LLVAVYFPAVIPGRCNRQGPITKSPSEGETMGGGHIKKKIILESVIIIYLYRTE
jgi:hypothetical protein